MPTERVVIRSSWSASFANIAIVAVTFVLVLALTGNWTVLIVPLVVIALMTCLLRYLHHIVLTPVGLEIWWLRYHLVPWNHIGAVVPMGSMGGHELAVFDAHENRTRRLSAPRGVFGVGKGEVAAAQALVEQWWVAYRGAAPLPATALRPPGYLPGSPEDPYAPPAARLDRPPAG